MELATTIISVVGTLCGALGGIALTSSLESRRQQRQADSAAASERAAAHRQACTELLDAIAQLRIDVDLACARYWRDMNVRLAGIQEQTVAAGVRAARVAMISPDPTEADAALALGKCASRLSAWTAKSVKLGDFDGPDRQFVAGEISVRPDFTELDELEATFLRLVLPAQAAAGPRPGAPAQANLPGTS